MRHHEAKALAAKINETYQPQAYTGDGLEVISALSPSTNTTKVLAAVARWHEAPWRKGRRHRVIAQALRTVSGTVPEPANDNRRPRHDRRVA